MGAVEVVSFISMSLCLRWNEEILGISHLIVNVGGALILRVVGVDLSSSCRDVSAMRSSAGVTVKRSVFPASVSSR